MAEPNQPSPYVGLQPYGPDKREFFFGREDESRIITSNLIAAPLTILYGPSGVGKSSLLRAGVVPELQREAGSATLVFAEWHQPDFLTRLRQEFAAAVTKAGGPEFHADPAAPLDELLASAGRLLGGPVMLIFDQFEEYLLTHAEVKADDPFESQFARSVNRRDVDAGFLISLREDWLSRLDRFRVRIPNLLDNVVQLTHLKREAGGRAIREPLRVYNERYAQPDAQVSIEDALVQQVLDQVATRSELGASVMGAGVASGIVTPFLQLVMERLWNEEYRSGVLRLDRFRQLGGAHAIVTSYLGDVMRGLADASQAICARMFVFLVTPSGTKIPQKPEDLADLARADIQVVRTILEDLADRRILCRIDRPERYEVFHDALAPAILRWRIEYEKKLDRADAERRAEEQRRRAEEQRLRAEHEAAEARRFRILAIVLGLCLIAAIVAAGLFLHQRRISFARELAVASIQQSETGDSELGILLALQAARASDSVTAEAEAALHRAVQRSRVRFTLRGHQGDVNAVGAAAETSRLVTAGADGTARVWDGAGSPIRVINAGQGSLHHVSISANGSRMVSTGEDGSAAIWDLSTGDRQAVLRHEKEQIAVAVLSPDGTMAATAAGRRVRLWNAAGQELRSFDAHIKDVAGLSFSTIGRRLATASADGETKIWDTEKAKLLRRLLPRDAAGGIAEPVRDVVFDPRNELRVATASEDGTGRIWNTEPEDVAAELSQKDAYAPLPGHSNVVQAIAFSPDGKRVGTASWDRTVRIWDASTGQELLILRGHTAVATGVAFTAGGSQVVTSSKDGTAKIWDVGPLPESLAILASPGRLNRVAYNRQGDHLVTAAADHTAKVWDAKSGKLVRTLQHEGEVTSIAFSPDGSRMATGSADKLVKVWDADSTSSKPLFSLDHPDVVVDVAFSADGQRIATGCFDDVVRIWNLATRTPEWTPQKAGLTAIAYDGRVLAAASVDGTTTVWNVAARKPLRTITAPRHSQMLAIALSADGRTLATGSLDGSLLFGRIDGAANPKGIAAHSDWLRSVAYSPDGKHLASTSRDGTVILWDSESGVPVLTLDPRSGPISSAAFAQGGRSIATAGEDGTLRVFTLDVGELEALARSRVTRGLTDQECATYLHLKICRAGR